MLPPTTLTVLLLLAASLFVVGLLLGWLLSNHSGKTTKSKLKTMVAIAVTFVWISTTLADMVISAYSVSPLVHALMGAIVGYFFTEEGLQFNIGGNE